MAFAKSAFIILYMLLLLGLTIKSAFGYSESLNLAWLGALMSVAPMLGVFLYLIAFEKSPRTSARLPLVLASAIIGTALATFKVMQGHGDVAMPLGIAIIGLIGLLLYLFWYSKLDRSISKLGVGKHLPAFTVESEDGQSIPSTQFKGKPTIFLFYRGNWCPLCVAQIKEIAADYQKIASLGAEVVLISPQPHKHTKELAEKFGVPMCFCVDKGLKAARTLGIFAKFGTPMGLQVKGYDSDTVMPTVIITNASAKIIYLDETDNYRVRPEPSTFLNILKEQNTKAA